MDLRTYLYRDDDRINEFLQQIQAGQVGAATISSEAVQTADGEIDVKLASAGAGSSTTKSRSFTIDPTAVSRAKQLEELMSADTIELTETSPSDVAELKRGSLVSYTGVLQVPEIVRLTMVGAALGEIVSLAEAFGQSEDLGDTLNQVDAMNRLLEIDGFPIVAPGSPGCPDFLLIADMSLILGNPLALGDGEATVVGRLKRKIPEGTTIEQSELLPSLTAHLPTKNRQQRRRSGNGASKPIVLKGPSAIIDPVMIYE